jgi:hypothetical protein
MTYQLATAKVWDGSAWVPAAGGGAASPWYAGQPGKFANDFTNVTATANTSAHTKGAWTELVASTTAESSLLFINVSDISASGVNTATLLDVAVGAAGSETVIASNVAVGGAPSFASLRTTSLAVGLPVRIPAATRVSARIQSVVTGGKTARLDGYLLSGPDDGLVPTSVDVLTGDTATSEGLTMSGASGTYVEVVPSTTQKYRAFVLVPSINHPTIQTLTLSYVLAVGAATAETDLGEIGFITSVFETVATDRWGVPMVIAANVPAGSRLSIKHDIPSAPDRYAVTVIGIP